MPDWLAPSGVPLLPYKSLLFTLTLIFQIGHKAGNNPELSTPDSCILALLMDIFKHEMEPYIEALLVTSYEMMLVDNGS